MKNQFRSFLFLFVIILLPILFYGYLQLTALSEDEAMAEKIYQRQMETILFSLNQYADDVMSSWANALNTNGETIAESASKVIQSNESIRFIALTNLNSGQDTILYNDYVSEEEFRTEDLILFRKSNDSIFKKLVEYLQADFQKIQAVEWIPKQSNQDKDLGVTFMMLSRDSTLYNVSIFLEERYWAEGILGSKMQKIATDNFGLAVLHKTNTEIPELLYQSGDFELLKNYIENKLWILPDIYIAIQSSGENYVDLIRSRSRNNVILLFLTVLVILIGIILIIRNIRATLKITALKSDFVSNVSHEIRTPLALIRMYAETLLMGRVTSEEKMKKYYEVIFRESGRLTFLVNNILDFSRIEANKKTYQFQNCELNSIVLKVREQFAHAFEEKSMECKLSLAKEELSFQADSQAVEEAISNLIDNAIKYNETGISISIKTSQDQKYVYCEVTDNGIGIPAKEKQKIFDKFYRLESALTQKTKGTGLGLSLVKHIMLAHKGEVLVESKLGKGSTFTLKFPRENKK